MVEHGGAAGTAGAWRGRTAIAAACLALSLLAPRAVGDAAALTYQEDETIDRAAGILGRPWQHAVPGMITADYLNRQSRLRTGSPSYDQQPPAALTPPAAPNPVPNPAPPPKPKPSPTTDLPAPKPPPTMPKSGSAH